MELGSEFSAELRLDAPPERLPADSIQLIFLFIVLVVGIPSNLLVLRRLLAVHKTTRKNSSNAAFLLLKLHLTLSDLMLLLFFVAPQLIWNITYEWTFGDFACKLYNYVSMASFYLSSNITVCIALERLRTVLRALRVRKRTPTNRSVLHLILPAWLLAFSFAFPQLVVFRTADILPQQNETWIQCSDVWKISGIKNARSELPEWFLTPLAQLLYEVTHLLLVFWVPLVLLLLSYGTIALRLNQVSSMDAQSHFSSMHRLIYDQKGRSLSMPTGNKCEERVRMAKRMSLAPAVIKKKMRSFSITSHASDEREAIESPLQGGVLWRRRIREKLFRSTLLIVIAHFLFWFPYNFTALLTRVSHEYKETIELHAYFLNDLQVVITLVNPVLYAITE